MTKNQNKPFQIMGIINVTPDSFSDGGDYFLAEHAVQKAKEMVQQGADWIDLGAESSRPGSTPVSAKEEWQRLEPVLSSLKKALPQLRISVDTYKPDIMIHAAKHGASMINCIKGVTDLDTLTKILNINKNISYLAMHMHDTPQTMQDQPLDGDSTEFLEQFCKKSKTKLLEAGFTKEQIWLDPGIGFGKSDRLNHACLKWASRTSNKQIVLGISRKSYIGRLFNIEEARKRDDVSNAIEYAMAISNDQIKMIRTHRVEVIARLRALSA